MPISLRHKLLSALGSVGVVALMGYLLLVGLPVAIVGRRDVPVTVVTLLVPRPPEPPRPVRIEHSARHPAPDAPSPPALRAKAAEVVAPTPAVPLPAVLPVVSAALPNEGDAAATGASDRDGPGNGAGGEGTGDGGGFGDGDGGDRPPRLRKGRLSASDLPADLRGVRFAAAVSVRYAVGLDGRVGNCAVTRSSGYPELDGLTCRLIEERFRYAPARDSRGEPFEATIEEDHRWSNAPDPDAPPKP